jgi:hypothetical protein
MNRNNKDAQDLSTHEDRFSHEERVRGVFRTIEQKFGKKFNDEENRVLEAIVRRDPDGVQRVIDDMKAGEDWYEEEFIKHPQIAATIRELSIKGF